MMDDQQDQEPQHVDPTPPTSETKSILRRLHEADDETTNEVTVEASPFGGPDLQSQQRQAKVPPNTLGLFPADSPDPILFTGPEKMVLGRASLPETSAIIDLTPYNAIDLGVSRRHAAISLAGSQYLVEDLGSMNGTWLHESRLPIFVERTLTSGDVIRVGQLPITVYFTPRTTSNLAPAVKIEQPPRVSRPAPETAIILLAGAEELILAVDTGAVTLDGRLTVDFLSDHLVPFLRQLEQLQRLLDEMQGRARRSLVVGQIVSSSHLSVTASGVTDAVRLDRAAIVDWRRRHSPDVHKLIGARVRAEVSPLSHDQEVALEVSEAELTAQILAEFGGRLPPADLAGYARRLIEPVRGLIYSPLSVVPPSDET